MSGRIALSVRAVSSSVSPFFTEDWSTGSVTDRRRDGARRLRTTSGSASNFRRTDCRRFCLTAGFWTSSRCGFAEKAAPSSRMTVISSSVGESIERMSTSRLLLSAGGCRARSTRWPISRRPNKQPARGPPFDQFAERRRDRGHSRRRRALFRAPTAAASQVRDRLAGRIVVNLFFENSTRTLMSFAIAAHRLGAQVVTLPVEQSSVKKGETLEDTARTLNAMRPDAVGHPPSGERRSGADRRGSWTAR